MASGRPPATAIGPSLLADPPLIGRARERSQLMAALREAKSGTGTSFVIQGPAGMGKTRLARWAQEVAGREGFRTSWGYCLREVLTSFFPFEQIFSRPPEAEGPEGEAFPSPLPPFLVMEEEKPVHLLGALGAFSQDSSCLWVGRQQPSVVRAEVLPLPATTKILRLSRGEGADDLSPSSLDVLGQRLAEHLRSARGSLLLLNGTEYLASQNGMAATVQLVHFLRDVAEETGGHLLLSLNPSLLRPREVLLLESDADVVRAPGDTRVAPVGEPPSTTMLRYMGLLEGSARAAPQLVVLDDLQWADPHSLRTFRFLARNFRKLPIFLLATMRTDVQPSSEGTEGDPLRETLEGMQQDGTLHRLDLAGLSSQETSELAAAMFGESVTSEGAAPSLEALRVRSGGNPFYLREVLRDLTEDGFVRRERGRIRLDLRSVGPTGSSDDPHVPVSLQRLLSERLARLDPEERELLEWAAISGSEVDLSPLAGVLRRSADAIGPILDRLEAHHHLLETRGDVGEGWRFAHPLVWETSLALTPPDLRVHRARRLADWWADHRPNEVGTVARLYYEARDAERGLPWVRKAIARATEARAPETVERYHRWLLELLELAGVAADHRAEEGLALAVRLAREAGLSRTVLRILQGLLRAPLSDPVRWAVASRWVSCLASLDPTEGQKRLAELRSEVEAREDEASPDLLAQLATTASFALGRVLDFSSSLAEAERALSLQGPTTDVYDRARTLLNSGWALGHLGRRAEAEERLRQLCSVAEASDSLRLRLYAPDLEGFLAWVRGDLAQAQAAFESAAALHRRLGDYRGLCVELYNLSLVAGLRGMLSEAMTAVEEVERLSDRFDYPTSLGASRLQQGAILFRQGRLNDASLRVKEALELFDQTGYHEYEGSGRALLAEIRFFQGSPSTAIEESVRAEGASPIDHDRLGLHLVRSWALEVEGDPRRARDELDWTLRAAQAEGDAFVEAQAKASLARWERAHGDAEKARELRTDAEQLFDRCGVLPTGWVRHWPPEAWPPNTT